MPFRTCCTGGLSQVRTGLLLQDGERAALDDLHDRGVLRLALLEGERPERRRDVLQLTEVVADRVALGRAARAHGLVDEQQPGVGLRRELVGVAAVLRALNVSSRTQAVLAVSQMAMQGQGAFAWRLNPPHDGKR